MKTCRFQIFFISYSVVDFDEHTEDTLSEFSQALSSLFFFDFLHFLVVSQMIWRTHILIAAILSTISDAFQKYQIETIDGE